jgi:hypothetical protein
VDGVGGLVFEFFAFEDFLNELNRILPERRITAMAEIPWAVARATMVSVIDSKL